MSEWWLTRVIQLVEAVIAETGFGSVTIFIHKGHVARFERTLTEIHTKPTVDLAEV